jgi:hypothetical protein
MKFLVPYTGGSWCSSNTPHGTCGSKMCQSGLRFVTKMSKNSNEKSEVSNQWTSSDMELKGQPREPLQLGILQ